MSVNSVANIAITDEDVISFLRQSPDFFERCQDELKTLGFSDTVELPFLRRQLAQFKKKEQEQQDKIQALVNGVNANKKLESGLHELALRLVADLRQGAIADEVLITAVKQQFNMAHVVCFALACDDAPELVTDLQSRVGHLGSTCDDRLPQWIKQSLFGDAADSVLSCAFIPVTYNHQLHAVLILGSDESGRFVPGMGDHYLNRIGELAGAVLYPDA